MKQEKQIATGKKEKAGVKKIFEKEAPIWGRKIVFCGRGGCSNISAK